MKKLLILIFSIFLSQFAFACHSSKLTLVSGPTAIGGGQYSTTVQVCIGQTANWGGTQNFTLTLAGATYVSFLPATITNNYNAYTAATCAGPNCFMNTCGAITATATGTIAPATVVTYNTTSSVPAGYPIVPDDNETCGANAVAFCFNFTFVSLGYPTSITLGGNLERLYPKVCRTTCGFPLNANASCNGAPEPDETILFSVLPIELLSFSGEPYEGYNLLKWVTATETNNDYFSIERSIDGINFENIGIVNGAGNSSQTLHYSLIDDYPEPNVNYYRLKQVDFNGQFDFSNIIAVDNKKATSTKIYPNPTNGNVMIFVSGIDGSRSEIHIKNVLGQELDYVTVENNQETELNTSTYAKGIYFIEITNYGKSIRQKLMKN